MFQVVDTRKQQCLAIQVKLWCVRGYSVCLCVKWKVSPIISYSPEGGDWKLARYFSPCLHGVSVLQLNNS